MDTDDSAEWDKFCKIFAAVSLNWKNIKNDSRITNIIDFNKSTLCSKLKQTSPLSDDAYIQSYVLSMTIFHLLLFNDMSSVHD